jgi:hypothetical protein
VAVKSTPSNKELLKELPVGVLPKTEPLKTDADWLESRIKTDHDLQGKLELLIPVESRPRAPIFPPPRSLQATELSVRPRTTGESGLGNPNEMDLRVTPGQAVLLSVMFFTVIGSPGIALLWVAVLGLYLSTFNDFRTSAKNTFREGLTKTVTYAGSMLGLRFLRDNAGKGTSNTSPPECLKLDATARVKRLNNQQRKLAKQDVFWYKDRGLLYITPEWDDAEKPTHYHFKAKCRINMDSPIVAQIGTDSHLNLISAKYFERVKSKGSVTSLNEQPTESSGLGTSLKGEYPPVTLTIQIGHCVLRAPFIVSKELTSTPALIGSDFLVRNKISVAPHEDGRWWLYVGPIDDPFERIPALVSNQLTLCSVHPNIRRTSLREKRGSVPSQDSEERNPESRHSGVEKPEAPAPRILEQGPKTPPELGKQNSKGPKVKKGSCGSPKKTKKQNSLASPPKQRVKKPSKRKSPQPHAEEQEPLGNEAKTSGVEDKVQAHLRWRSALFEPLNYVGSTDPGKEIHPFLSFPCLSNVLKRPFRTTENANSIWKYTIGQSVIL